PTPTTTPAPAVRYASDTAYRVVRNGWGPVEKDRSNGELAAGDGRTLTVGGQTFAKGFGVHAPSEIVVPVGGASTFTVSVGIDAEVRTGGSMAFQVWSGSVKLADSGVVRGGQAPVTLTVDVAGRGEIRLVATDGGNGVAADHGDWGGARLS
ncbi:glycosyl hydrolase, partial [Kineococcus sp. R8]|uniref:NPCBM/NEW2 domain-containing protein n=1 Tax=Kineococcus siccus TaxID=2696567 RepID=UPI00196B25AF